MARYEDAQARLANAFRAAPAAATDGGAPNLAPGRDAARAARAVRALETATPVNVGALRKLCTALQAAAAKDGGASLDAEEFLQARGALMHEWGGSHAASLLDFKGADSSICEARCRRQRSWVAS